MEGLGWRGWWRCVAARCTAARRAVGGLSGCWGASGLRRACCGWPVAAWRVLVPPHAQPWGTSPTPGWAWPGRGVPDLPPSPLTLPPAPPSLPPAPPHPPPHRPPRPRPRPAAAGVERVGCAGGASLPRHGRRQLRRHLAPRPGAAAVRGGGVRGAAGTGEGGHAVRRGATAHALHPWPPPGPTYAAPPTHSPPMQPSRCRCC